MNWITANVLASNPVMMRVFNKVAEKMEIKTESGVYQIRFELPKHAQ